MNGHDPRVLIIDDEVQMRRFLRTSLLAHGYLPIEASTGGQGIAYASSGAVDIVLLDMGLPDIEGTEVARELRQWTDAPIIVLSARTDEKDKIAAFEAGANDYLTKPFAVGELLARMRVVRRQPAPRVRDKAASVFTSGHLRVDLDAGVVFVDDREVHLTPIEYKLIVLLIENVGRVMTHQQLLKGVWGTRYTSRAQYLHVYMGRLRAKIDVEDDPSKMFVTVPGVGYRLRASEPVVKPSR
ncbi:MAG TPA: response regulator transcription factor [Polyangiales bacterium]